MWDFLPVEELHKMHKTPNYGCAGGVCEGRYQNIFHAQARARIKQIDEEIAKLLLDDPTRYYVADFEELEESKRLLLERLEGPYS